MLNKLSFYRPSLPPLFTSALLHAVMCVHFSNSSLSNFTEDEEETLNFSLKLITLKGYRMCEVSQSNTFVSCGKFADFHSLKAIPESVRNQVEKLAWYSDTCVKKVLNILPKLNSIFATRQNCQCFCGSSLLHTECPVW